MVVVLKRTLLQIDIREGALIIGGGYFSGARALNKNLNR